MTNFEKLAKAEFSFATLTEKKVKDVAILCTEAIVVSSKSSDAGSSYIIKVLVDGKAKLIKAFNSGELPEAMLQNDTCVIATIQDWKRKSDGASGTFCSISLP